LLQIVQRYSAEHRILLLEDAAYRELTFAGEPPASIKSHDKGNEHVALVQTFSKPFAPGVKTGYGLLPRDLMGPAVAQKGNHDFGSAHLTQHLMLAALRSGLYAQHVAKLRERYAAKCRAMLEALDEHLGGFAPGETRWTKPNGGLYVYLTLPADVDTGRQSRLFSRAIAEGVLYVPGEYCYGPDPTRAIPRNQMRLSFGLAEIDAIREGVRRLAVAIRGRE
jgi:2-aminoadipate transaminase